MKITINAIYWVLIFITLLMMFYFISITNRLDRIEQQLAVCSALPASQREGGAE